MRVLIHEPDLTGHHAPYLRHLIRALTELGQETVLVTHRGASASPQFALHLQDVSSKIEVDESGTEFAAHAYRIGPEQFASLQQSIAHHRPDHVWVPFADFLTEYLGVQSMLRRRPLWSNGVEAEGLYFRGRFAYPVERWQKHFTRALARFLIPHANWNVLHWLDPIALEALRRAAPEQAVRHRLMPDPVEKVSPLDPQTARATLSIAEDGRYVGCVGVLNRRKGIDLMLAGFRRARLASTDRLLLAGPMDGATRQLLEQEYGDLLRANRIITIDRNLSVADVMLAVSACDLVCVPSPFQMGSSSFVIRAAAARRPVLTADFGWMGWTVPRFKLGWTTNVRDAGGFGSRLQPSLDAASGWTMCPAADRFVHYHSAANFAAHWTARLRDRLQLPPDDRLVSWEWVLDERPAACA
jgi:glycosyltransferase involved in cell wall biosynthesis